MPTKLQGFAHIVIVAVIALLATGAALLITNRNKISDNLQNTQHQLESTEDEIEETQPGQTKSKKSYSSERQFGKAKITESGEADIPIFGETVTGKEVDQKGTVLSITLKSGTKVHFIITGKGSEFGGYAELAELAQMPATGQVIPLYTSQGYGVSAFIDYVGLHPTMFLVFDFSKGKILSQWEKIGHEHRCKYDSVTFQPEVCAALLGVPADQTINKKYTALDLDMDYSLQSYRKPDDLIVPQPFPSYYLGTDELLVVNLKRPTFIIPQTITKELARDLAVHQTEEAVDIARNTGYNYIDPEEIQVVTANYQWYPSFKAIYNKPYLETQLNQAIAKLKETEKNNPKDQDNFFGFTLDVTSASLEDTLERFRANENSQDPTAYALQSWKNASSADPSIGTVAAAANLFRAGFSNLPGAEDTVLDALDREATDIEEDIDAWHELRFAFEQAAILQGDIDYRENLSSQSFFHRLASHIIKPAYATIWRPNIGRRPWIVERPWQTRERRRQELDRKYNEMLDNLSPSATKAELEQSLETYKRSVSAVGQEPTRETVDRFVSEIKKRLLRQVNEAVDSNASCEERNKLEECCKRYFDSGCIPFEGCELESVKHQKSQTQTCEVKMYKTLKDFGDNKVTCHE